MVSERSYFDQELRDPQLTRGMTRICNDVQSNLGPHFLQCTRGRRLMVAVREVKHYKQTVSVANFQKGMGHFGGTYGAYNVISSLDGYCRYMTTAKGIQAPSITRAWV